MYFLKSCTILTVFCAFVACHTSQKLAPTDTAANRNGLQFSWPQPEWLALRGEVDYNDPTFRMGFSVNIRYRRDSVIWLNASKFGFEAVRALVTKDSVFILNHMDKSAIVRPLTYIEQQFGIPASFPEIERLLLGGPPSLSGIDSVVVTSDTLGWRLRAKSPQIETTCTADMAMRLTAMMLKKRGTRLYLSQQLSAFAPLSKSYTFPMQRTIEAFTEQRGQSTMTIRFSDPEADVPKAIKFEVPTHYTRL